MGVRWPEVAAGAVCESLLEYVRRSCLAVRGHMIRAYMSLVFDGGDLYINPGCIMTGRPLAHQVLAQALAYDAT